MRAVQATRAGGPEVLEVVETRRPSPGPGEVLVEIAAAGVNFLDTYRRSGVYPMSYPHVVGTEGAGVVTEVGPDVHDLSPGERIAWVDALGSYAEYQLVPTTSAVRVPDGLELSTAAAAALQGITANFLVTSTYEVQPGDDVLVHAAAGGVGMLVVQLARARGARVIGTVSTAEKEQRARAVGAQDVIRYTEVDDVAGEVRRLTDGQGVAVAYDGVGKDTFESSLASLRRRGMLVLFGGASGQVPPFDPQRLNHAGSVYLTRPTLAHYIADRDELVRRADEVFAAVLAGEMTITVADTLPLEKAADGHSALEGRLTSGKLLVTPSP